MTILQFPYPASEAGIPAEIKRCNLHADRGGYRLVYQCPDAQWESHFATWQRQTDPRAPEPFPFNHFCFKR